MLHPNIVPALFAKEFLNDDQIAADIVEPASHSKVSNGLAELSASFNSVFVKSREDWLEALIAANFGKTDKEIVNKAVESWKTSIDGNISYHEEAAKLMANDDPVRARQHRLLAAIYSQINNR